MGLAQELAIFSEEDTMSRNISDRIESVLKKFVDNLIRNTTYYVTEKYTIKTTQKSNRNYRPQTNSEGMNRQKLLNWQLVLIQPSEEEMLQYIQRWCLTYDTSQVLELTKDDWQSVIMGFMDKFVQEFFVYEVPQTRNKGNLFMGYRPSSKHEGTRMQSQYFMNFITVQPSRDEIYNLVNYWLANKNL